MNGLEMWTPTSIGEILTYLGERVEIDDAKEYITITVKRRHGGLKERERLYGYQIKTKKQFRLIPGSFIISRVQCWHQAYAIVPEKIPHNMIASSNYDQFSISGVDKRFFWWLSHSSNFNETVRSSASGVVIEKMVFDRESWLKKVIRLPPLEEQRRIARLLDDLATRIEDAKNRTERAKEETKALWVSILSEACAGGVTAEWRRIHTTANIETAEQLLERVSRTKWPGHAPSRKRRPMSLPSPPNLPPSWATVDAGELQERGAILDIQDGNHGSNYPRKSEFAEDGVPFVTAHQMVDGKVNISSAPRLPSERAARLRIGFAKSDDVLLTHNASVGAVAIAPSDAGDFLIGTSVTYWRCNPAGLEPRYLHYFMQSEQFQGQLRFIMKQTTRNQVSVLKQVNLWICVPPLLEQGQIAAELDAARQRLETLGRLNFANTTELDALLPAATDRAFKGEL
jgi:hypothetical protein